MSSTEQIVQEKSTAESGRIIRSAKYWTPILLSPKRLTTVGIAKRWLTSTSSIPNIEHFGNYAFDPRFIDKDSVIYSFGIGRNVSFDCEIAKALGCKVYLIDPSRNAITFAKELDPGDFFECVHSSVWLWDGEQEIFGEIREGEIEDASFTNQQNVTTTMKIKCQTIPSFMKRFGHEKIDILKMDIEGAALIVLDDLLTNTKIRPKQIGVELERPKTFRACLDYWSKLRKLIAKLEGAGYKNYCKTFKSGNAIEMISIQESN